MSKPEQSLAARSAPLNSLTDVGFWQTLCPMLSVSSVPLGVDQRSLDSSSPPPQNLQTRMREDGYFQAEDDTLSRLAPLISDAMRCLVAAGIPPVFIFVYDEPWTCFHRRHDILSDLLGPDYLVLPDFWAWHVDPAREQSGWTPHRDKGWKSLSAEKMPLSLTIWIPLTDATPLNGCMYMLPASRDPAYGTPQDDQWQIDLPSIRALPAEPGDYLCWNQAVLHWGAKSSRFSDEPRISMAMEFQSAHAPAFNRPLIRPQVSLVFSDRLKLIAKQILQYKHMYPLSTPLQDFATEMLSES